MAITTKVKIAFVVSPSASSGQACRTMNALRQAQGERTPYSAISKTVKEILFVCVHNAGRSQMAEAFFNRLVQGRAKAFSGGTRPAPAVNPTVVQAMLEAGIDIGHNVPRLLTPAMLKEADRVITMGCGVEESCPALLTVTEDWGLEDPAGKPLEKVREIRDEIKARVIRLIEEVEQ